MWLLLCLSWLLSVFAVMSRAALNEFSLADAEEVLRIRGTIREDLPLLERFAEELPNHSFSFLMLIQLGKAMGVVAIWNLLEPLSSTEITVWLWYLCAMGGFLITCDTMVRPIAVAYPEYLTMRLMRYWKVMAVLMWLPFLPFRLVHNGMGYLIRRGEQEDPEDKAEDDIMAVVSLMEATGRIQETERDMIEAVLRLNEITAAEVMTPRTDMTAISIESSLEEAYVAIQESGHSRMPVYKENRDVIIGVLYVKDMIASRKDTEGTVEQTVESLMRQPLFIPESNCITDVLSSLRQDRVHLAVVLDEYGGTAGVVTLEDIVEEVFGEIEDEYDEVKEEDVRRLDDASLDLDARMKVQEVNERFDINLPENDRYESIGGLVTCMCGHIPEEGEEWTDEARNCQMQVLEATDRRVVRLRLLLLE